MKYNKEYHAHHIDRLHELHGVPLATFWQRAMAFIIDALAAVILLFIVLLIYGTISGRIKYIGHGSIEGNLMFPDEVVSIIWEFAVPIIYFGLLTFITQGKTLGKWIMGIRVVPITHHRISLLHSVERAMAYATSIAEFGFGFVQYFMNVNHRTLCDKVGETIVINDRKVKRDKKSAEYMGSKLQDSQPVTMETQESLANVVSEDTTHDVY